MAGATDLIPGTLDLLILKAVSLGKTHGFGANWNRVADAIAMALRTTPQEL
jgi:hypothetical protein